MPTVVLTEDEVLAICELAHQGQFTQQEIADQYGITRAAVGHIKQRRNWGHLTDKPKGNDNGSRE
jgi:biotin operon repressor